MEESTQFDIKKNLQILIRRKYVFIAVSLAVLSVIVWGSYFMPVLYKASSTVFIEKSIIRNLVGSITTGRRGEEEDEAIRGLRYTMLNRDLLMNVIKAMDLDAAAEDESYISGMIWRFQKETEINERQRDNYFTVSYKGSDPELVRDYVNTLVDEYIKEIKQIKREEAYGASKFISDQIDYYKEKVDSVEEKIAAFRRQEGIYLAADENALVTNIKGYTEEMEDVEMEIGNLEAKKKKIIQQMSGEEPFTLAMVESGGDSLPARLRSLEQQMNVLLTKYTENYPEVIKIKVEIETIKKLMKSGAGSTSSRNLDSSSNMGMSMMNPIYQQLKEEQLRIDSEVDSLRAKEKTLTKRIQRAETELKNIPKNRRILANLERDRDTYKTLYEQLLAKLGQAEVNEQVEMKDKGKTYNVVEAAALPTKPVSPDRVLLILFGLIAGIAAGMGAVLLLEKLDSSVRDIDSLKSFVNVPILAIVPHIVTEQDIQIKKKRDFRVYTLSVCYLLIIGVVFIIEFINRFF